jgi:hypothetical protein
MTTEIMLVGDTDCKRILGGPNSRLADNIKLETKQSVQDSELWTKMPQQDLGAASVNTVFNI